MYNKVHAKKRISKIFPLSPQSCKSTEFKISYGNSHQN